MVYGKTGEEIIALNEDSLWSGYPRDLNPRNKAETSETIRDLAMQRRFAEAQALFEKEISAPGTQFYLPLGDMLISFDHRDVKNYARNLDLDRAVATVRYEHEGVAYTRELFVSAPDNCLVLRLASDTPGKIRFRFAMTSQLRAASSVREGRLCLDGIAPSDMGVDSANPDAVVYAERDGEKGMRFTLNALPVLSGGHVSFDENFFTVSGADSAVILVNAATSFAGWNTQPYVNGRDEKTLCSAVLTNASAKTYGDLLERHRADYGAYYDRVAIDLGENENAALPTDKRLRRFAQDAHNKNDPALYSLLFQYGRYLLISASRPGTQAANLQGIWNRELHAPWRSNYTININTQMNYWPAFPCALEEMQLPLIGLIGNLAEAGRVTAKEVYGTPGWVSHHNADIWALTWPVGNHQKDSGVYANWNLSPGWLCAHLFERYEYTLDKKFLGETAYPVMKAAAEFYAALLTEVRADREDTENGEGRLMLCPSTSPENSFVIDGEKTATARTATMSTAVIRELFTNCVNAAGILGIDRDFAERLSGMLKRLVPFRIGSKGQLLEWDDEYEETEPHHRHTSHLYGLHPGSQISAEKTPDLAAACAKTLELRGDGGTGWALAWKVNFWARLRDGDHALTILNNQLRPVDAGETGFNEGGGTYPNMFDAHPPFQIDGNYGVTAGIAEMLLQNTPDGIALLPALPGSWKKGRCTGLRAKGRLTVDLFWDGDETKALLSSAIDRVLEVSCRNGEKRTVTLRAGETAEWHDGGAATGHPKAWLPKTAASSNSTSS
jgi:alpha-L-fucosidase 2